MLYLSNQAIDALERRLRDPEGAPPSAAEIVAAVASAGSGRKLARAQGWAVAALHRAGAAPETILAMMDAAQATAGGRDTQFAGPIASNPPSGPTPAPDVSDFTLVFGGEALTFAGETLTFSTP